MAGQGGDMFIQSSTLVPALVPYGKRAAESRGALPSLPAKSLIPDHTQGWGPRVQAQNSFRPCSTLIHLVVASAGRSPQQVGVDRWDALPQVCVPASLPSRPSLNHPAPFNTHLEVIATDPISQMKQLGSHYGQLTQVEGFYLWDSTLPFPVPSRLKLLCACVGAMRKGVTGGENSAWTFFWCQCLA